MSPAKPPSAGPPLATEHLTRRLDELDATLAGLADHQPGEMAHRIYRAAATRLFEVILELSGMLLRKHMRAWFSSDGEAERLSFRDVFRAAAQFLVLDAGACERWLEYRDLLDTTAHDYGEVYPEWAIRRLPRFLADARALQGVLSASP